MISVLAYAKIRGVSHVAVLKAIKTGRLSKSIKLDENGKAKIADVDLANREWTANTDQAQQREKVAKPTSTKVNTPPESSTLPQQSQSEQPSAVEPAESLGKGPSYAQSRAIREAYQARLSKIDYEERSGKLLPSDAVRVTMFNAARKCRDMLLGLPDRVAPLVLGNDDQHDIHRILTDEIRRVCVELAAIKPPAAE